MGWSVRALRSPCHEGPSAPPVMRGPPLPLVCDEEGEGPPLPLVCDEEGEGPPLPLVCDEEGEGPPLPLV